MAISRFDGRWRLQKALQSEVDAMSRAEKVEFIIERDLQPSHWYWDTDAWTEAYMSYLILIHKWESR